MVLGGQAEQGVCVSWSPEEGEVEGVRTKATALGVQLAPCL